MNSLQIKSADAPYKRTAFWREVFYSTLGYMAWGYAALALSLAGYSLQVSFVRPSGSLVLAECQILLEAVILLLLYRQRIYRMLPLFSLFIGWSILSNILIVIIPTPERQSYFRLHEFLWTINSGVTLAVFLELMSAVLRPIRLSLPRYFWILITFLIGCLGLLLWPVAGLSIPNHFGSQERMFLHLELAPAMLKIVVFLLIAGFSQLLSIGWRDREFQVAAGLGFCCLSSFVMSEARAHAIASLAQYDRLDEIGMVCYLIAQVYWVFSFGTKSKERTEFSPKMQSLLLRLSASKGTKNPS